MTYAAAKTLSESAIPVIDIGGLQPGSGAAYRDTASAFLNAARSIGFFYVTNHGIQRELITQTFELARQFFALPQGEKERVLISERHRGFLSVGQAKMQGSTTVDLKESFIWGREFSPSVLSELATNPMIGRNQWPQSPPGMSSILNEYFEACVELGKKLLRVFAVALEIEPEYFTNAFEHTLTRGSILYYPPQPPELGEKQFGVAPHTDYGCLTLLYQDSTGGLQVLAKNGSWVAAVPIADTYVVNVGDLLARWTNNRFRSTPHRVVNTNGRARYSVAVFVDPDFDTPIAPVVRAGETPKFPVTNCGEYILSRFDKSFVYRAPTLESAQ